jgi:protein transport protein SEC13
MDVDQCSTQFDNFTNLYVFFCLERLQRKSTVSSMEPSGQAMTMETAHTGPIVDVAADTLGRRLASGGEDGHIQVWEVLPTNVLEPCSTLTGHAGAIVQLSWAHNRFGGMIASCSADKVIMVWVETAERQWIASYTRPLPNTPTSIAWAPHEYGPQFACATANGKVFVFTGAVAANSRIVEQWDVSDFDAHPNTCTSLSWAPCLPPGALCTMPVSQQPGQQLHTGLPPQRIVTAGNERGLKVWRFIPQDRHWAREELMREDVSASWVEVAWAPNLGLPFHYIAGGSVEGLVMIWRQDGLDGKWSSVVLPQFGDTITRLSWSHVGTFLLVSCADQTASLWRETPTGEWEQQSMLDGK